MLRIAELPETEAADKVARNYERLRELLEVPEVPFPFRVMGRVPALLQDFFMNYKKFLHGDGKLDARTRMVIALAVSSYSKSGHWADFFAGQLKKQGGNDQTVADVIAVAATNSVYNVFFKFRDLSGSDVFSGMGVGLRASTFSETSLDEKTVELINLALSDINSCRPCTEGHLKKARQLGLSDETLNETIQCAAVVYGACHFLNAAGY